MSSRMDVVIPSGPSTSGELRFALRSIEANLPHRDLFIIGEPPLWYAGPRIFLKQTGGKHRITNRAMRLACETANITDPFIWANDDFFVMRPGGPPRHYHAGPIREVLADLARQGLTPHGSPGRPPSPWARGMSNTLDILRNLGYDDPLGYELHVPIVVHKEPMLRALAIVDEHGAGQKRTIYGNIAGLGGTRIRDVKVRSARDPIPTGRWLSTMNATFHLVLPQLLEQFPEPSRWELHRTDHNNLTTDTAA